VKKMAGDGDKQQCFNFRDNGDCRFGDGCRFWHGEVAPGKTQSNFGGDRPRGPCYQFQADGFCRFGDDCRFSHDPNQQGGSDGGQGFQRRGGFNNNRGSDNRGSGGYQRRDNDNSGGGYSGGPKLCYKFRDTGNCNFGDNCKFSHDAGSGGNQSGGNGNY